ADWVFVGLHLRGVGQRVIGYLDGISAVLQVPGVAMALALKLREGHHIPPRIWCFVVIFNFLLWVIGFWIVLRLLFPPRAEPAMPEQPEQPVPDRKISRRDVLVGGVRLAAGGAVVVGAYSMFWTPRRFEITRRSQPIRDLPPELEGLRIV